MGIVKDGVSKGFSGKVGKLIYSQRKDGLTTVRENPGKSDKPLTQSQLSTLADTSITAAFIKPIKGFIEIGYELQGKLEKRSAYNALVAHIRHKVITGTYPERRIDFASLLVTTGQMQSPENAAVSLTASGLSFSWDAGSAGKGIHYSDQIMLLAYFPALKKARYRTAGAQRHEGADMLSLEGMEQGFAAEIYISFIADDRRSISDSIYLGQLIW